MYQNGRALQFEKLLSLGLGAARSRRHSRTQSGGGNDDNNFHGGERSINAKAAATQIEAQNQAKRAVVYTCSGLMASGTTAAGVGPDLRTSGRDSTGRGAKLPRSSNLPKIIFPAVVCNTEV